MHPLSWLLPLSWSSLVDARLPSTRVARDDSIDPQSIWLKFKGCEPKFGRDRQSMIYWAWEDAIKIAKSVGKINFQDVAAVDFFGPPSRNKEYQGVIQDIFDSVITFGQGLSINPIKWTAFAQCAAFTERKNGDLIPLCQVTPGLRAYTWNSPANDGIGADTWDNQNAYTYMHFCDTFFDYDRVDNVIRDRKRDADDWRYNLDRYKNTGESSHIVLHEMMHSRMMTYKQNRNRPINDLKMLIREWKHLGDGTWTQKRILQDAYGALYTRTLARTQSDEIATDITQNADNFAQYALAVYVRSQLDDGNGYPFLPIAEKGAISGSIGSIKSYIVGNDSDWGLNGDMAEAYSKDNGLPQAIDLSTGSQTANSDDDSALIDNLQWTPDAAYPPEYIQQQQQWSRRGNSNSDGNFSCNGLDGRKYVSQAELALNIKDFCSQAAKQGTLDKDSGSIMRNFDRRALDEVDIAMDWTPGLNFRPDEAVCNDVLKSISDNCDGNDPKNPMDWKGGGKDTRGEVTYSITPKSPRQPLPNAPGGGCDVRYKVVLDKFNIWGNGYATAKFGQETDGLLAQIKKCGATTKWKFSYGLGDDGREWSAEGQNLVFTSNCIEKAIKAAGGPGIDCSGNA